MAEPILLTNIQRFSLHDGPGIRTTVFLKGCSLRCPWCSNPENLFSIPQSYVKDGVKGVYGKYKEPDELVRECLKDKGFYQGENDNWNISDAEEIAHLPGGVTFSGGECLLQMRQLLPVCKALHDACVHIAVETCLFVPPALLDLAIRHIDFFYVDMKILAKKRCKEVEHGNLDLYLSNLDILLSTGRPVVIRVPVIGGQTDDTENRKAVKNLLTRYKKKILKVELIKEHDLGRSKYASLHMPSPAYIGVSDKAMEEYRKELIDLNMPVEICRI